MKHGMDVTWLLCLSVVLFLNGLFDALIIVSRLAREKDAYGLGKLTSEKVTWFKLVIAGLLILGPVVEMSAACICWRVYREHFLYLTAEGNPLEDPEPAR